MQSKGFTLVELLIVLVIIAIGVMTVTPLMVDKTTGEPEEITFLNGLLSDTAKQAAELGRPLPIRGRKGSNSLFLHDGKTVKIPNISEVGTAEVNSVQQTGVDYVIMVYPNKMCDYFLLKISDKIQIEAVPLLLQVRRK